MDWCADSLEAIGISCPISYKQVMPNNPELPVHRIAYLFLREAISYHLATYELPELRLSAKPHAALN